jgi:hypothetical protein
MAEFTLIIKIVIRFCVHPHELEHVSVSMYPFIGLISQYSGEWMVSMDASPTQTH